MTRAVRAAVGRCVRKSGEILTSDRLVGHAKNIDVTTADGQVRSARVVGRDTTTDLVLLRVVSDGANATAIPASFGTAARFASTAPKTGDSVFVVGAPSPGDSEPAEHRSRRATDVSFRSTADRPPAVCSRPGPRRAPLPRAARSSTEPAGSPALFWRPSVDPG
jgi:hypothetical protein